jgi:galactokinase
MTGGGFGGSVVALVRRTGIEAFKARIASGTVRTVEASDGAREVSDEIEAARVCAGFLW